MTYLSMCQALRRVAGVAGTGPTTVVGQTGELGRIVAFIADNWTEMQAAHSDWKWLRVEDGVSFATTDGQHAYTPTELGVGATLNTWALQTFRSYTTSAGQTSEVHLQKMRYDAWRDTYLWGGTRLTRTQPVVVAVRPSDRAIMLGPVPSADYTVTGDYYRIPVVLTADADVPAIPQQFHMAIVYRALIDYGYERGAMELVAKGQNKFAPLMAQINSEWRPGIRMGTALA